MAHRITFLCCLLLLNLNALRCQILSIERLNNSPFVPQNQPMQLLSLLRELRQSNTTTTSTAPAPSSPPHKPTIGAEVLISLLTSLGAIVSPLSTLAGSLLGSALNGSLYDGINYLEGILQRDHQNFAYENVLVNTPQQGQFVLMAKNPAKQPSTVAVTTLNLDTMLLGHSRRSEVIGSIHSVLQRHSPTMMVVAL